METVYDTTEASFIHLAIIDQFSRTFFVGQPLLAQSVWSTIAVDFTPLN